MGLLVFWTKQNLGRNHQGPEHWYWAHKIFSSAVLYWVVSNSPSFKSPRSCALHKIPMSHLTNAHLTCNTSLKNDKQVFHVRCALMRWAYWYFGPSKTLGQITKTQGPWALKILRYFLLQCSILYMLCVLLCIIDKKYGLCSPVYVSQTATVEVI